MGQSDIAGAAFVAFVSTGMHRKMTVESFHALFDGSALGVVLMDKVGLIKVSAKVTHLDHDYGPSCSDLTNPCVLIKPFYVS